jgi:hypothetical protein
MSEHVLQTAGIVPNTEVCQVFSQIRYSFMNQNYKTEAIVFQIKKSDYNGFWGGGNPLKSLWHKSCDAAGSGDTLADAGHICPPGSFPFPGGTCLKPCGAGICT